MSVILDPPRRSLPLRVLPPGALGGRRARYLLARNLLVYRYQWIIIFTGFFEPLFYLLSLGLGIEQLVGDLEGVSYAGFVAPALLASSAMNGAIYESTMNIYYKLKHIKVYDAVLTTPVGPGDIALGEIAWCLIRGAMYGAAFLIVMAAMGLIDSGWAVLALPGVVLIGFAFAATGMAATTFARSWADFEILQLVMVPLFLFSATFYPLAVYGGFGRVVVQLTPLYHGVALERALVLGDVGIGVLVHVAYLAVMGCAGLLVAGRRLGTLLLR